MASSCRTVVGPFNGYGPGLPISPVMNILRLLMVLTTTATLGSSMYRLDSSLRRSRSCSGVSPAAWMSFKSGSEIRPSGRTDTSVDMSLSFQYTTDRTSSGPMTYPGGGVTPAGGVTLAAGAALAAAVLAASALVGVAAAAAAAP